MRRKRIVLIVTAAALLLAPLVVLASHRFTDVPDSNVFHEDIGWLADAGVTLGCNPPENTRFCPSDNVTREQMSAFMRRLAENRVVDAATVEGKTATELEGAKGDPGPRGPQGPRGNANVTIYNAGPHDFSTGTLVVTIPDVSEAEVHGSLWRVDLVSDGFVEHIPGGVGGLAEYEVYHDFNGVTAEVTIRVGGPGLAYDNVRITQIAASETVDLPAAASTSSNEESPRDR